MLVVVSPAKKLDWSDVNGILPTVPEFQSDAVYLAGVAGTLSPADLQKLMSISPALAELNHKRFQDFLSEPEASATRPAVRAFAGDTYQGFHAQSLTPADLAYAQDHLRVLSGLYGLLRPLDAIQPYRLEMGSKLKTSGGGSLYAYWGARIADALNAEGAASGSNVLINCASREYFGAVDLSALKLRVITPVFLDEKNGEPKIISFHAKRARGAMARFVVENRVGTPKALAGFDGGGYRLDAGRSTPDAPVFVRPEKGQKAA
jgi:cytoplasmic iron level regulating protein YaaA (DUF328/UPF0246 family)